MSTDDDASARPPAPGDFDSRILAGGLQFHVRHTTRFKSVWVDVFLGQMMQPGAVTRLALLARLLERGTRRLPDLRALNRHTDWLYGAALSAQTLAMGPFQVLHLHYDALHGAYVPQEADNLLECGLQLLGEVLTDPFLEDGVLPPARIEQEKASLRHYVSALHDDRTMLAQRRLMEQMCAGTPWALAPYGDPEELSGLDGANLLTYLRDFVTTAPMDIYVCGDVDSDQAADLCTRHLPGAPKARRRPASVPELQPWAASRRIHETGKVSQGRLLLGFRTPIRLSAPVGDYATLILFNLLFGGDAHSRLYNHIREEEGLCYHIASYMEPMAGLLLVEAGVEPQDRRCLVGKVLDELSDLATQGPSSAEIERSQALSRQRLDSAAEGRGDLVHFHQMRRLAGTDSSRLELHSALGSVTSATLRTLAAAIVLDTEYFLAPVDPVG